MGSAAIHADFGEEHYPIGRFILERARALGMSRSDLVQAWLSRHRERPRGAHCGAADGLGGPRRELWPEVGDGMTG